MEILALLIVVVLFVNDYRYFFANLRLSWCRKCQSAYEDDLSNLQASNYKDFIFTAIRYD